MLARQVLALFSSEQLVFFSSSTRMSDVHEKSSFTDLGANAVDLEIFFLIFGIRIAAQNSY